MNICYVSDVDISRSDGPGVNEREFTRALQAEAECRGDRISFVIPKPRQKTEMATMHVDFYACCRNENLPVLAQLAAINLKLIRLMQRKIRGENPVFVVRLSSLILPAMLFCYLRKGLYCIKTLGDIYYFHGAATSFIHKMYRFFIRLLLKLVLKKALFIDVCTPQLLANYQRVYNLTNIHVMDNGVNTDRFYPMDKERCKRACGLERFGTLVGYCGGYPSQRGVRELIEVSQNLFKRYPDCGIVVVGHDSELESLKKRAKELGTDGQFVFRGIVNYEKVSFFMNCLDVGVGLDTGPKITFVGNASQKIRQYLACGVPFVCPAGTNEQLVKKGFGVGVPVGDLDAFLESICHWLDMEIAEKEHFVKKANQHMRDHYSVRVLCGRRYSAWKAAARFWLEKDSCCIDGCRA